MRLLFFEKISFRPFLAGLCLSLGFVLLAMPANTLASGQILAQSDGGSTGSSFACPENTTNINGLCVPNSPEGQEGFASADTLPELALKVLQFLLTLAGVIAVVAIIIGGYWYMTAAGNEEQSEKGKKALIQAVIGLVVVVLAYTIVTLIIRTVTDEVVF